MIWRRRWRRCGTSWISALALGYCLVDVVLVVGAEVSGFAVGDRVVRNGKQAEVDRSSARLELRYGQEVRQ